MDKIKEIQKIIDKAIMADLVDGRIGTLDFAEQIADLYKPPEEALLKDKDLSSEIFKIIGDYYDKYINYLGRSRGEDQIVFMNKLRDRFIEEITKAIAYTEAECKKKM